MFQSAPQKNFYEPDLIAAPATSSGPGAVSLTRLSGRGADAVLQKIFSGSQNPVERPREMIFGRLLDPNGQGDIDSVLVVFFPGPNSFTGEDTAEIFGHGGSTVPRLILEAALAAGARLAEPGEFTQRAFLNGKLSLDQAEAVADLVASQSEAEASLARRHLAGALTRKIEEILPTLVSLQAEMTAILDFEEDWDEERRLFFQDKIAAVGDKIADLASIRKNSRIFRDGFRLVLAGPPNAGKSSLFNALLGRERALVSPRAGTTRDYLEASLSWSGLRVELVDTAGVGEAASDELEGLGQKMTLRELEGADLVIWLAPFDAPEPPEAPLSDFPQAKTLTVWSKADLAGEVPQKREPAVSAKTGLGLDKLKELVLSLAGFRPDRHPEIVPNLRQQTAIEECQEKMQAAQKALEDFLPPDIVALELSQATLSLNRLTGKIITDEVLQEVFSRFCVGK
ncbi:MAG: tRNA uridine-5-carboxymethylaminomethyl(34) synthesis GTPase MnmE [Deltaproteobacteria bacterium]|nr:tRNA uridine-5-carboxymethylaminomethyl(34) synthesis GTPase MnmE [Deltaproteobacteria bacterium]